MTHKSDVLILGGGPAGLSCARALRGLGVHNAVLLERESALGGIPRHCGHVGFGLREFGRICSGPDYAKRLADQAAGTDLRLRMTALKLEPGGLVRTTGPNGPEDFQAKAVVLAFGARETPRSARLISGSRPFGVMNTGALQQFVYLHGKCPFQRPVVIGSELVAFSTLLTLRHVGIKPLAIIEENERITAREPGTWVARLGFGVPVLTRTRLIRIIGRDKVTGIEIDRGLGSEEMECDGVILTGKFRPETALIAPSHLEIDAGTRGPSIDPYFRCSDHNYFAAGNMLRGIETAGQCWREGRAVAEMVIAELENRLPAREPDAHVTLQGPLAYVYPQRIYRDAPDHPLLFKARVSRAVRGRLSVVVDGKVVWSRRISALPERRIAWRLPNRDMRSCQQVSVEVDAA
ncbi:NAD(P)/FAD-dependent oxidoreductase [Dongia deserti]|uniref:NAD(P)/FAD-dependent oxidoreductase n=1 Tax=Dongia deserti TaxID=2268030 RepID=UPI000E65572A|nr:FAD/NAD(P)-binding oxidoreductase [Dongia deserti]